MATAAFLLGDVDVADEEELIEEGYEQKDGAGSRSGFLPTPPSLFSYTLRSTAAGRRPIRA